MTGAPLTAKTITDEQIRELRATSAEEGDGAFEADGTYLSAQVMLNLCDEALGELDYGQFVLSKREQGKRRKIARSRCAAILAARASKGAA